MREFSITETLKPAYFMQLWMQLPQLGNFLEAKQVMKFSG